MLKGLLEWLGLIKKTITLECEWCGNPVILPLEYVLAQSMKPEHHDFCSVECRGAWRQHDTDRKKQAIEREISEALLIAEKALEDMGVRNA